MTFAKVLEQECRELFNSVILDSTGILYCQLDGDSQKIRLVYVRIWIPQPNVVVPMYIHA